MLKEEKRLKEEIRQLLGKAEAVDEQEDQKYGVDSRGDELFSFHCEALKRCVVNGQLCALLITY